MYEFRLNTSQASFERWLEVETAVSWTETRAPGCTCTYQRAARGRRFGHWGIGAAIVYAGGPGELSEAYSFDECVTVDLLALSDTRLRVRVASDGLGAAFLADLVERICRDYPEAATGAPEARETPALAAGDAGAQGESDPPGASPLQERPDWDGKKAKVLAWLEARKTMSAAAAAVKVGEAESSLKNWRKRMVKLGELGKGG